MINRILEFYLLTLTYSVVVITSDFLVSSVSSTSMYVILNLLKPSTRPWVIKICQDSLPPYGRCVLWKDNKNHEKCVNTIEILCQGNVSMYGVLDITSDTKFSSHESKSMEFWIHVIQCPLLAFHHTVQLKCENSVSRRREWFWKSCKKY